MPIGRGRAHRPRAPRRLLLPAQRRARRAARDARLLGLPPRRRRARRAGARRGGDDQPPRARRVRAARRGQPGGSLVRRGRDGRRPGDAHGPGRGRARPAAVPLHAQPHSRHRRLGAGLRPAGCAGRIRCSGWPSARRPPRWRRSPRATCSCRRRRNRASCASPPHSDGGPTGSPSCAPARSPAPASTTDAPLVVDQRADWFALVADEFGLTFEGVDPAALDRLWRVVRGGPRGPSRPPERNGCQRYGEPVTPDEFRKHGYQLIDWIVDYLEHVEQHPVASPRAARRRAGDAPRAPADRAGVVRRRASPTSTASSCPASPTGSTRASSPTSPATPATRRSSATSPPPASACRA